MKLAMSDKIIHRLYLDFYRIYLDKVIKKSNHLTESNLTHNFKILWLDSDSCASKLLLCSASGGCKLKTVLRCL